MAPSITLLRLCGTFKGARFDLTTFTAA